MTAQFTGTRLSVRANLLVMWSEYPLTRISANVAMSADNADMATGLNAMWWLHVKYNYFSLVDVRLN